MTPLTGTVALVTGTSSGIGHATALALAARGASVALVARRQDRLEPIRNEAKPSCDVIESASQPNEAEPEGQVQDSHFGRRGVL